MDNRKCRRQETWKAADVLCPFYMKDSSATQNTKTSTWEFTVRGGLRTAQGIKTLFKTSIHNKNKKNYPGKPDSSFFMPFLRGEAPGGGL